LARRNKREPFNPFAPDASSKAHKKVLKQQPVVPATNSANFSRQEQMSAMKKKIKEEQDRIRAYLQKQVKNTVILEEKEKVEVPKVEVPKVEVPKVEVPKVEVPKVEVPKVEVPKVEVPKVEVPKVEVPKVEVPKVEVPKVEVPKVEVPKVEVPKVEVPKVEVPKVEVPKVENKPSRLEDLKRRSDALAAKTGVVLPKTDSKPSTLFSKPKSPVVPVKKPVVKPRSFRKTKTGGGRQPKQHKLSRRKQLEFRFDARAILNNSTVAEEHRSNVFGQIWAKGERIGIDSAIEYISQKEQEGILTSDVSGKLVALIKSYTTKR